MKWVSGFPGQPPARPALHHGTHRAQRPRDRSADLGHGLHLDHRQAHRRRHRHRRQAPRATPTAPAPASSPAACRAAATWRPWPSSSRCARSSPTTSSAPRPRLSRTRWAPSSPSTCASSTRSATPSTAPTWWSPAARSSRTPRARHRARLAGPRLLRQRRRLRLLLPGRGPAGGGSPGHRRPAPDGVPTARSATSATRRGGLRAGADPLRPAPRPRSATTNARSA